MNGSSCFVETGPCLSSPVRPGASYCPGQSHLLLTWGNSFNVFCIRKWALTGPLVSLRIQREKLRGICIRIYSFTLKSVSSWDLPISASQLLGLELSEWVCLRDFTEVSSLVGAHFCLGMGILLQISCGRRHRAASLVLESRLGWKDSSEYIGIPEVGNQYLKIR